MLLAVMGAGGGSVMDCWKFFGISCKRRENLKFNRKLTNQFVEMW